MFYFIDSANRARTSIRLTIRGKDLNSPVSSISLGIGKSGDDKMSVRYFGMKFGELRSQLEKYGLKPEKGIGVHYQITCISKDTSKQIEFIDKLLDLCIQAMQKKFSDVNDTISENEPENQLPETINNLTHDESDIPDVFDEIEENKDSYKDEKATDRDAIKKSRIGQGKFREETIKMWDKCCAITGLNNRKILKASHIKPWRDSSNEERLDPNNGLLLIPNLDVLFDQGLISFDDGGNIMISEELNPRDRELLGLKDDYKLKQEMPDKMRDYMKYHREQIFQG